MTLKNHFVFLLDAFAKANPAQAVVIKAGSMANVAPIANTSPQRYSGTIMKADGGKLWDVTWTIGTFPGVMSLDPDFAPTVADTAGTTVGLFKTSTGSYYFVLNSGATATDVINALGYDFAESDVTIDTVNNDVVLATEMYNATLPVTFLPAVSVALP